MLHMIGAVMAYIAHTETHSAHSTPATQGHLEGRKKVESIERSCACFVHAYMHLMQLHIGSW